MRRLVLVLALSSVPTSAAASSCYLGPFITTTELPAGCPLVIYTHAWSDAPPVVYATRDSTQVDVTGDVERDNTLLGVQYPEYNCEGDIESVTHVREEYARYRVAIREPMPGETVTVHGHAVRITTAGACPAEIEPAPVCGHVLPPCRDDEEADGIGDGGGCQTSGNSFGGAAALGLLALLRRRRRQ